MRLTSTFRPQKQIKLKAERKLKCHFPTASKVSEGDAFMQQQFAIPASSRGEKRQPEDEDYASR